MLTEDQLRKCSGVTPFSTLDCGPIPVCSIAFSSGGDSVASVSADGTIRLWDCRGKIQQTLQGHSESAVTLSLDGSLLVSVREDEPVQLWDVANGTVQHERQVDLDSECDCVTFSPSGKLALASGEQVQFWDTADDTWGQLPFKRHENLGVPCRKKASHRMFDGFPSIKTLAFSPQETFLACGYDDGMIKLWDISRWDISRRDISKRRAYYLQGHSDNVTALAFSSGEEMMASASHDGKIWLWHLGQACDKPHGCKLEGKELEGSLAFSHFDTAGTICALAFSNSSCSIRAGVINPQKQGSYSVSIYEVA